jgi:glycosyltransferase involved in cell wall biosynthesis
MVDASRHETRRHESIMRLFINSLAASAGGGRTYIRNVIPHLAATPDLQLSVAAPRSLIQEFQNFSNVDFIEMDASSARRFWYEQSTLRRVIRDCRADVLLSAGNFAVRSSPLPQILLSRNSLYTSNNFYRDLRRRRDYRTWMATRLQGLIARKSIAWADMTVAPSETFAAELRRWTGNSRILAIHHGFDREAFIQDTTPLTSAIDEKLKPAEDALRLLFVSHYNYYRNFETLIRALPLLRQRLAGRRIQLLLTCMLLAQENPGSYRPEGAARLIRDLGVSDAVVQLGSVPYRQLHQLYRRADVYVTPAYAETFAHPLVEAMSSSLPVVASDLPVHREICSDAALYFSPFSPEELADRVVELASSADRMTQLSAQGLARSSAFSWKKHVDELLRLARSLLAACAAVS